MENMARQNQQFTLNKVITRKNRHLFSLEDTAVAATFPSCNKMQSLDHSLEIASPNQNEKSIKNAKTFAFTKRI
jgi:hypothetical protein